jgi:4-hydroxybenzoate polyprenyltransferase
MHTSGKTVSNRNVSTGGSSGFTRLRRPLIEAYVLMRFSALGFTLLLPLLGATSAAVNLTWSETGTLLLISLSFHIFAYVFNDVMDLGVDRTEPLRADSLLVQGKITRSQALWLAWLQLPTAIVLALIGGLSVLALAMFGVAVLSMSIYNVYGKRCRFPLLTDAVQAAGWCLLVLVGAMVREKAVIDAGTVGLLAYVFTYVLLINGIHGGLRDLRNDIRCGARTTAIWLGARPGGASGTLFSARAISYAACLQAAIGLFAVLTLIATDHTSGELLMAASTVSVLYLLSTGALYLALTRGGVRRDMISAGALHIVVTLSVPLAVYLPQLNVANASTMLLCFTIPVAAMYAYNGRRWCL